MKNLIAYLLLFLLFPLGSCKPEQIAASEIPEISLKSFVQIKDQNGKDSLLILTISYADADGDIGLSETDTMYPFAYGQPFFYNLKIDRREKVNGNYEAILDPFTLDTLFVSQRLPVLTPTGRKKAIKGDITVRFDAVPYPSLTPDTIRCYIQLFDRALHGSNVLDTEDIHLVF